MATRDFILEIGCEELPSAPLNKAIVQFNKLFNDGLDAQGLSHGEVSVLSSPRRLTVIAKDVAEATEEVHQIMRGPAAAIAFDAEGNPTKAAQGFARGRGLAAEDLIVKADKDGKEYVFAEVFVAARDAKEILVALAEKTIGDISWPRSQRWGTNTAKFVRPIRWICCLFGNEPLRVSYADVVSGTTTQGHRVLAPGAHEVADAQSYVSTLRDAYVMLQDERRQTILDAVKKIEQERNGAHVDMPAKVFDEVVNLCEWPDVLVGKFDQEFLEVPHEIICESMLTNQRYFPIYDAEGKLTREFVVVSNADPACAATVIDGNERVVRARLSDAKFFYEEDLSCDMEQFVDRLKTVVFQEKLGTVYQKSQRIEKLAEMIAKSAGATDEVVARSVRSAHLAKADLVSQAVIEFTSQQGVMGGYYASAKGEPSQVADAIREHYRPRFAGDELSSVEEGRIVACADKMDTICGIFAIGEPPTGSSDPFAVRRATIGVIALLKTMPSVSLDKVCDLALAQYQQQGIEFDADEVKAAILKFFLGRMRAIVRDEGVQADTIEAVSASSVSSPLEFMRRAHALEDARSKDSELFEDLAVAYARAAHLGRVSLGCDVDKSIMGDAEVCLLEACEAGTKNVDEALASGNYEAALRALADLRGPIDRFFDDVLVMDEDTSVRENRLKLLNVFTSVFDGVANIGALAKKK